MRLFLSAAAAKAIPLLASNHIQVNEGGVVLGYCNAVVKAGRLADPSCADAAAKALGPFELVNTDNPLRGCR